MVFEFSCFISYRHCERKLGRRIIEDLYEALSGEIEMQTQKKVYIDRDRLRGGDLYNEELAVNLCKSICMVVVYTPTYFDKNCTYCAREFMAMESLEKRRLRLLEKPEDKRHGLIIPIIFRGRNYIPQFIKSKRQVHYFDNFLLSDDYMYKHPEYAPKIKMLADYIAERCKVFDNINGDNLNNCNNFSLPNNSTILKWLDRFIFPSIPFPGRKEIS